MTSSISSLSAGNAVQSQYLAGHNVPSPTTKGTTNTATDTVELSSKTQQYLAQSTAGAKTQQPQTISEIIKEAADGDVSAMAKLTLVA